MTRRLAEGRTLASSGVRRRAAELRLSAASPGGFGRDTQGHGGLSEKEPP